MKEFLALHNRTVTRTEIEAVIEAAKEQQNTAVIYRLSRILNAHPSTNSFVINIRQYPETQGLSGAQHTGDYKEALDNCGRLKKGWKFSNGQVVKVTPKAKKTPDTPTATMAVEGKQLIPYTAEKFAKDLDINKLERSLHWLSFDPKGRAKREQESYANIIAELYNSHLEQAKQTGALESYNATFDKGYSYILKNYLEMVGIRARTFSTAITGGGNISERKIANNEKLMRSEHERLEKHIELQKKLEERLAKVAKNTPVDQYEEGDVIKSTDNNATTKLQQKLKMLQDRKTMLKNGVVAAKEYQKNKDISVFKQYNIDSETTEQIINHIDKGGKPTEKDMYSWFTMPYLNRDIKEVENRIATLEKNQAKGTDETLIEGGKIVYNGEAQRLQIFFDGIPSKEVREALKAHAFKWAPTAKAWQRTLTENAKYAVNQYLIKTGILKLRTALSVPSQDDEITFLAAAGIDYLPEAPDDEPQGLGKPVPAADIYKMVTDKVISMFKDAKASDYHRAWKDDAFFIPLNYDSKKPYRGVNRLLLEENIGIIGSNPYFLTFKQIKKHGGKLKKGSKGYEVIYYTFIYSVPAAPNRKAFKTTEIADVIAHLQKYNLPDSVVKRVPLLRYYRVFNGKDVEGIDFKLQEVKIGRAVPDSASENEAAQLIVENYPNPPAIKHGGNKAYYERIQDLVRMPKVEQFDSVNDYYRTLFHELTHSTRHENRLNREKISFRFGDTGYAKEELVAEFGAVFLSAWAGILWYNNKNHAAYLKGWNNVIEEAENDNKFIMQAAAAAQKATDYILNLDANGQPAFLKKLQGTKDTKNTKNNKEKNDSIEGINLENLIKDFNSLLNQIKKENKDIAPEEVEDFLYHFGLSYYDEKETPYYFFFKNDIGILSDYKKHPFFVFLKKKNIISEYELTPRGKKVAKEFKKSFKELQNHKLLQRYSLNEFWWQLKRVSDKLKRASDKSEPSDSSSNKNTPKTPKSKTPKPKNYDTVKTIAMKDLFTDEKRFQNRKKLNEEIVDNIVKNFKPTDLDPLVVWYDKKQDKTFVLAGHHRFEALKRLKHKTVPVKYANEDYPTEADAIRYAKEISNANRTLEEPYERAAIYRKCREEGYSEKDINEKAALEGKNRSYVLNLSWLNPKGATMSTLVQFSQTQSKADKNEAERIADWIGQARRNAPELTDAHEKEMFDFLTNKEASKRTTNKAKFLEYVRACYNPFEPTEPLNLARIKYQSEGEKQYDEEVEELKNNINKLQGNITDIKDRFINPNNPQYINPTAPDYLAIKQIADNKIAEYNAQIQYYQKKLLEVYQNKKNYIKPTGQMALFGKYPETDTQRLKKMKEVGKNKKVSHFAQDPVGTLQDGQNETLSANTTAKNVPNSLNLPDTPNLAAKMVALQARNWESFKIANPQMQRFLGDVELKESESTVITIGGGAGSGKTRFAFQFINALAQNYKVGHASLEEHPDSKLYYDKVKQYLDPTALANVEAPEIKNLQQLDELIQRNEVIVIDSFAKLRELDSRFMLDRDLRKKYNSKLFLLIYQLTGEGKMRGGSESEFDGDIILLTHVSPDYRENYIYPKKNRYNALPATQLRYSTYYQQMLPTEDTLSGSKEASNNTYEIIY
ncbi:zincin-like metallopeptidase domain-containing protein [uncultured Capnocytophaga sp.]|uniref:zincin-like metallopeptidase domain-containing protein n=1 Tax=uncultured Capnocytophaga sp. TaxID=159273 RepID=UPI0025997396|nr:zincin-like metallopeptidase domain-containing protein [uncultured Capnocytophaga sp.]